MEENIEKVAGGAESAESGNPESVTQPEASAIGDAPANGASSPARNRRQEKVGLVTSDKMQKTVVVRVERQVRHTKYRRYIRQRTKFMAHDELGARVGDIVRIIETRPLSARKRWRVVEIVQKGK